MENMNQLKNHKNDILIINDTDITEQPNNTITEDVFDLS
jgi:spore coat polysaccharide biosynthesis predicted glycosyltransferase SpsG